MTSMVILAYRNIVPMDMLVEYFGSLLEDGMETYDELELMDLLFDNCYWSRSPKLISLVNSKDDQFEPTMITEEWVDKFIVSSDDPMQIMKQFGW